MARRSWNRDETLVAFNVYCRTPFGRLHARNPEIIEVATALDRTPSAVAMKCCNLAAFDAALQSRGISGLRKTSQLDAQVWQEFEDTPEAIAFESEKAYASAMNRGVRSSETVEWEDVQGLEKEAVAKVRVNQHFFRSIVLTGYRSRCAICEMPFPSLLIAAHIVPWSVDRSLRMNPRNGLCLCALHDRAFDAGILAVSDDYTISLRDEVRAMDHIPAVRDNLLRFAHQRLTLPERWHPDPLLLKRHREITSREP